jgi:hypothetical protein
LEFVQSELKNLCVKNEIEIYTTYHSSLEENGQTKSILSETTHTILCESKFSKVIWPFVEEIVMVYHNYTMRKCETKTLFKLFHYWKLNYFHIHSFRCHAYAHILKDAKRKLDNKTQLNIYLRPSTISISVKLWDYERNKLFKTNNILFNDNSFGIKEI